MTTVKCGATFRFMPMFYQLISGLAIYASRIKIYARIEVIEACE